MNDETSSQPNLNGLPVLVTGATGYIASRLIPALIESEASVRITSRHPERVAQLHPEVESIPADVRVGDSLVSALQGVATAYYLVHSIGGSDFEERDREAAATFRLAAERAGVTHLIYLGALAHGDEITPHLRSRTEVGEVLASGPIPVTELRAAFVLGSGSIGFEILRHLAERLPAMIAPSWLDTKSQPIAERDILDYLLHSAATPPAMSEVIEVGSTDAVSYRDMIDTYLRCRGLRRPIMRVPVLTPRLSSYWLHLVTPEPVSVARPLIESLRHQMTVRSELASTRFPEVHPSSVQDAIRAGLASQTSRIEMGGRRGTPGPGDMAGITGAVDEVRGSSRERLLRALDHLGADPSWYPLRSAWRKPVRRVVGNDQDWYRENVQTGGRIGRWKVIDRSEDRVLLKADFQIPGDAYLEYRVIDREDGATLRQSVYFRPRGVIGRLYWWGTYPLHRLVFRAMAGRIARSG